MICEICDKEVSTYRRKDMICNECMEKVEKDPKQVLMDEFLDCFTDSSPRRAFEKIADFMIETMDRLDKLEGQK